MFSITKRALSVLIICLSVTGCATWSSSSVDLKTMSDKAQAGKIHKVPSDILITASDKLDRKYKTLADLEVTVNKTTLFHADPTREMVNQKLQEEAAELGADAVILVRYGTVGVSVFSWGSLDGKGRAIAYVE
jgi:hypothetical protein